MTRSAASISSGAASRPVMITCWRPSPAGQHVDDLGDVDPAPLHRVGELVEHVDVVGLRLDPAADLGPALARRARRGRRRCPACGSTTSPRPSCATRRARPRRSRSCRRPSARNAVLLADLPLRRLHELEHPDRPALAPAAQREPERGGRLALHLAGVHDEQRAVAALAGGEPVVRDGVGTCPCGIGVLLRRRARRVHDAGDAVGRQLGERDQRRRRRGTASRAARPRRTGPDSQSTTTVATRRRPAGRRRGRRRGRGRRPGRAATVARPSVRSTSSGAATGIAQPLDRAAPRGPAAGPSASGVRPPVRRRGEPGLRGRARWTSAAARPRRRRAAEGDQPDLVAALVGVAQQRQHGAGDRGHAACGRPSSRTRRRRTARGCPRGPRARRGAGRRAAARARRPTRPRRRWCGAAAATVAGRCRSAARRGVPSVGRTTRPESVRARDRCPGAPSPRPGTCEPPGPERRRRRAARASRTRRRPRREAFGDRPDAASGTSDRPDAGVRSVGRAARERRRGRRHRRPGGRPGRARRRRSGSGSGRRSSQGLVERLLVDPRLVERVAAAPVRQRQPGGDPHVLLVDGVGPPPGRVRRRRAGDHEVGPHAVDVERGAHRGDPAQLGVGQHHRRQPRARASAIRRGRLRLGVGPAWRRSRPGRPRTPSGGAPPRPGCRRRARPAPRR